MGIQFNGRCYNPGFPNVFLNSSIKLLLKYIAKVSIMCSENRKLITLSTLPKMLSVISNRLFSLYVIALLECEFLLPFFKCWNVVNLSLSIVLIQKSVIQIYLFAQNITAYFLHSKHKGSCSTIITRMDSIFGHFCAMLKLLWLRKTTSALSPLFLTSENLPMSEFWFSHKLKLVLLKSGLSLQHYSGHSLRIGAATSPAMQGISTTSL